MKTLIMVSLSDNVSRWSVKDRDDAKYQIQMRVEKEGFEAELAFLFSEGDATAEILPASKWVAEYWNEYHDIQAKMTADKERSEYERLKKKFEK